MHDQACLSRCSSFYFRNWNGKIVNKNVDWRFNQILDSMSEIKDETQLMEIAKQLSCPSGEYEF